MVTRYVDLKFTVSGGKELKKEISSVNSELSNLKTQIKYVDSQFAGQENTIKALTAKVNALQSVYDNLQKKLQLQEKYIDSCKTALEKSITTQQNAAKTVEDLEQALAEAQKEYGENSEQVKNLAKQLEEANKKYKVTTDAVTKGNTELSKAEKQYFTTATEINKFGAELEKTQGYLNEAAESTDGCATSIDKFGNVVDDSKNKANKFGEQTATAVNAMATAIVSTGIKQKFVEIRDAIWDCVEASAEFESAMTGVAKTTDLSDEELSSIAEVLKNLSTEMPVTSSELANIMETAGQLGISKDYLVDFTKVMADMSASTNMSASDAASNLARFVNIMGSSQSEFENLGSAIVDLGNNYATTESEIVEMALNLAGAGKQANLSEADILGVATALSSLGIEAGKGGTAFSRVLTEMTVAAATGSEDLQNFADIAGMSADEFQKLFNSNSIAAINKFFTGLGDGSENAIVLLTEMGVSETRLRDVMLRLGSSSELLTNAVEQSNTAFEQNIALSIEANKRYATSESQSQMLANAYTNLKIAVGDELNPALNNLKKYATELLKQATKWVTENKGLVKVITSVVIGLGTFLTTLTTVSAAVTAFTAIQAILNTTMAAMPIMAICSALGVLVTVLAGICLSAENTNEEFTNLKSSFESTNTAFENANTTFNNSVSTIQATTNVAEKYLDVLDSLTENGKVAAENQDLYNQTVDQLNALLPDLNLQIDSTTGCVQGGTQAIREQITEWQNLAVEGARAQYLSERVQALTEAELTLQEAQLKLKDTQNELTEAQVNATVANEKLVELSGYSADQLMQMPGYLQALTIAQDENSQAIIAAYNEYTTAISEVVNLQQQESDLTTLISEQSGVIEEYKEDLEYATQAITDTATAEGNAVQPTNDVGVAFANAKSKVDELGGAAQSAREKFEEEIPNFKKAGEDTAIGVVEGINDHIGDVIEAGAAMGAAALKGYRQSTRTESPSKAFIELAEYNIEGLVKGVKDSIPKVEATYANLAENVMSAYEKASSSIPSMGGNSTFTINTTDLSREKIDYIYRKFDKDLLNG